jgi:hypothetical protein
MHSPVEDQLKHNVQHDPHGEQGENGRRQHWHVVLATQPHGIDLRKRVPPTTTPAVVLCCIFIGAFSAVIRAENGRLHIFWQAAGLGAISSHPLQIADVREGLVFGILKEPAGGTTWLAHHLLTGAPLGHGNAQLEHVPFGFPADTNKVVLTFHIGRRHATIYSLSKGTLTITPQD